MLPQIMNKRDKIKALRAALEEGNIMGVACRKAKMNPMTLCNWKKISHLNRLARFIDACRMRGQERRDDMVEDAQFQRLVTKVASGSEYEFYLTNRRTDRWKKTTEFGATQGAPALLKPPIINYISVSVSAKEPIDVTVENKPSGDNGRAINHV